MKDKYDKDILVAGGLSQTPMFLQNKDKESVFSVLKPQLEVFKEEKVDFMIVE